MLMQGLLDLVVVLSECLEQWMNFCGCVLCLWCKGEEVGKLLMQGLLDLVVVLSKCLEQWMNFCGCVLYLWCKGEEVGKLLSRDGICYGIVFAWDMLYGNIIQVFWAAIKKSVQCTQQWHYAWLL